VWVGKEASRLNKDACIRAVCQGLTDPAAVQQVIAGLSDFERAGLGFYEPLPDGTGVGLTAETTAFFEASYEAQAAHWVCAYRTLTGWVEHRPQSVWGNDTEAWYFNKLIGLRAALLLALATLPDATAWYRMTDLSTGIYSRLGEHFSLGYLPHFYPLYRATPAQIDQKRQEWQQQLFRSWQRTEQPWYCAPGKLTPAD
jgi:hypothetical protein